MHVLLLPKWYPGRNDPQLGDFIRKQALAAGGFMRMSVLHVEGVRDQAEACVEELNEHDGAWELAVRYRASRARFAPARKAANLWRYWRSGMMGWRRVLRERGMPDLLHAYIMIRPAVLAWQLSRRHGVPFIIAEQSSEYLDGTFSGKAAVVRSLSRFLCRRAKAIIAVSAHLGAALKAHRLCDRFAVVPNVVPGLDRALPPRGEAGHFMMVADLVDRTKNVSGVLRALANARQRDGCLSLTVIGDGPDRTLLERIVHDLGLVGHVRFLGRLANAQVLDHMSAAFAVIINSNVETFSVVTGEALAQGKPVIATRCGGPEAFITEENGRLIEPRDDAALAAAMTDFVAMAEAWDPARIRDTVGDRFGTEAVGRSLTKAYFDSIA